MTKELDEWLSKYGYKSLRLMIGARINLNATNDELIISIDNALASLETALECELIAHTKTTIIGEEQ